jgi:hypothetical protein
LSDPEYPKTSSSNVSNRKSLSFDLVFNDASLLLLAFKLLWARCSDLQYRYQNKAFFKELFIMRYSKIFTFFIMFFDLMKVLVLTRIPNWVNYPLSHFSEWGRWYTFLKHFSKRVKLFKYTHIWKSIFWPLNNLTILTLL